MHVGQIVNLRSGFRPDKDPLPTIVEWSRLNHGKNTFVASMWRKTGSPWEKSVADNRTFAVKQNGDLVIKRMDASLEGEYVQRYLNKTHVRYHVHILPRNPRGIVGHNHHKPVTVAKKPCSEGDNNILSTNLTHLQVSFKVSKIESLRVKNAKKFLEEESQYPSS